MPTISEPKDSTLIIPDGGSWELDGIKRADGAVWIEMQATSPQPGMADRLRLALTLKEARLIGEVAGHDAGYVPCTSRWRR